MKYIIDTEFIDDGRMIELISIGIVCENGEQYYAQSLEFDPKHADSWVQENVLKHLKECPLMDAPIDEVIAEHTNGPCSEDCPWRTREQLRGEVEAFIPPAPEGIEFIGWCASYDFVALCQLYGTMLNIPSHWPHYMRDIQYHLDEQRITDEMLPLPSEILDIPQGVLHHALYDAQYESALWAVLNP